MANVNVKLVGVGAEWSKACRQAVTNLNSLFKRSRIKVTLVKGGTKGPTITVKTDSTISGNAVHGKNSTAVNSSGKLMTSEVRLPEKVTINTPKGMRSAGPGIFEAIMAHEFVHALGEHGHNSHLMAETFTKVMGDTPSGDKLKAGSISIPPLKLSSKTVQKLKKIWN